MIDVPRALLRPAKAILNVPAVPIQFTRSMAAAQFRSIVSGQPDGMPDWVRQIGTGVDDGYFGPRSAAWTVNGSLATLVGGVRALLMQALHPAALAGVMQHSRFEDDALGRLAGTARWITVTTFGDGAAADRECARVRGLHRKVRGTYETPDGEAAYSASDPELLRWVHVAFTDSFLTAYRIWGRDPIPGGEDGYVREWAKAAQLVGVDDPPLSAGELAEQLAAYAPDLRGTEMTARTVDFIRNPPLPLVSRPSYQVLFAGAVASLPDAERQMLGLPPVPLRVAKPAVTTLLRGIELAVGGHSPSFREATARVERLHG